METSQARCTITWRSITENDRWEVIDTFDGNLPIILSIWFNRIFLWASEDQKSSEGTPAEWPSLGCKKTIHIWQSLIVLRDIWSRYDENSLASQDRRNC